MGNCASVRIDPDRRVWVRKRRQRPDHVRQQQPFQSGGTAYGDVVPNLLHRRRTQEDPSVLPQSVPVTPDGYPIAQPQQNDLTNDSYGMPGQAASPPQLPSPQMPMQMSTPDPMQQPMQQPMQSPAQQPMQPPLMQQPTTGVDPDMAKALMQNT